MKINPKFCYNCRIQLKDVDNPHYYHVEISPKLKQRKMWFTGMEGLNTRPTIALFCSKECAELGMGKLLHNVKPYKKSLFL